MVSVAHYCAASQSDSLAGTARPAGWMFFLPPATRFSRRSPHRRPPLPAQPPTARLSRGSSHDATFRMSAAELTAFGSGSKRFSSSCSTSSTEFPRPPPPSAIPQCEQLRREYAKRVGCAGHPLFLLIGGLELLLARSRHEVVQENRHHLRQRARPAFGLPAAPRPAAPFLWTRMGEGAAEGESGGRSPQFGRKKEAKPSARARAPDGA